MLICSILVVLCLMITVVLTAITLTMTMTDLLQEPSYGLNIMDNTDDDYQDSCDYIDPSSSEDIMSSNKCDLNIVQLNIRRLISKQKRLIRETIGEKSKGEVRVFVLNETWVTRANEHVVRIPNYNFIGKHRANKKGGGVGLAVHETIHYRTRDDIKLNHDSDLEYQFIELKARKRNILVGSMYRSPQSKEKEFLQDYKQLIDILKQHKDKEIVIGMDHNMDLLKASKHTNTQEFLDYNIEMNLLPVITKPTRITDTSATLIDNIFISGRPQHNYNSGLIISDMSDHLPTFVRIGHVEQDMKE